MIKGKGYDKLKELETLFKFKIPLDGLLMACTQRVVIDQIKLDDLFARYDSEYNSVECTYKGKECSMSMYVHQKFGDNAVKLLNDLM